MSSQEDASPSPDDLAQLAERSPLWLPALLIAIIYVSAAIFLGLYVSFPSIPDAFVFVLFVLSFVILPGIAFTEYLFGSRIHPDCYLAYVLAVGVIVDIFFIVPVLISRIFLLFCLVPPLAVAILLSRRELLLSMTRFSWTLAGNLKWAAAYLFCWLVAVLQLGNVLGGPAKGSAAFHYGFQGMISGAVAQGWPPANLTLPAVPLSYHYAVHLWIAATKALTGASIDVLVARYGPVFLLSTVIFTIFAFCRHVLKLPWWAIYLANFSVFGIFGVPEWSGRIFGTFTPYASILIMSPAGGFLIFFVSAAFIIKCLDSTQQSMGWHQYLVLGILAFVGIGARAVVVPILFCSLAFLGLLGLQRGAGYLWRVAWMEFAVATGAVGGLFFFFTLGGNFSGAGVVTVSGQPFEYLTGPSQIMLSLPHILMKLGFNWIAAGAIAFLVIAIFQPGFLAPVFLFELKYLFRERCDANRLLAGASIAGLCAVFLTNAPGYSHFTFLQYSNIAMSIIGAQGAVRIANRVQNGWCWRLLSLVLATAGLLVLQVIQIPPWLAGATWANLAAKHAVYVMPGGAQALHPDISSCVRPADLEMLRTIQRIDRKSIVVIPDVGNAAACEAIWWTAYVPLQTLQTYGVVNEPGAGSEKFQDRVAQLSAAFGDVRSQAAKGEVEVGKLSKLAALLQTERPVFVVLKKDVHLIGGPPLASIFANDRFVALQLPNSGTAAVSLP